jgi:hypothetical protein
MTDNKSSTVSSWWQTMPGILTGLAAIVTAVTGLIVAFNHTGSRSEQVSQAATASPSSGVSRSGASNSTTSAQQPPPPPGAASGAQSVPLPALHQVKLAGGNVVITILSAQIEPIDVDRRSLKLRVRYLNGGSYSGNFWSSSFRALVDDVPRAPTNFLDEVVASDSAKDGDVVFEFPVSVKDFVLQIGSGDDKSRIPFTLP